MGVIWGIPALLVYIWIEQSANFNIMEHIPDEGKGEPGSNEGTEENEMDVAPAHIQHCVEKVREVAASPGVHISSNKIYFDSRVKCAKRVEIFAFA